MTRLMCEVQFFTPLFCPKNESSAIFYQTLLLVLKNSARKAPLRVVFPEHDPLGWSRGDRSSAAEGVSIDTHVSQEKGVSGCPAEADGPDTLEAGEISEKMAFHVIFSRNKHVVEHN